MNGDTLTFPRRLAPAVALVVLLVLALAFEGFAVRHGLDLAPGDLVRWRGTNQFVVGTDGSGQVLLRPTGAKPDGAFRVPAEQLMRCEKGWGMNHTITVREKQAERGRLWVVEECSRPDLIPLGAMYTDTDVHVLGANGGWDVTRIRADAEEGHA